MSRFRHGVLVVGAGIAGSTLAIALARRGIAVRIVERQTVWQPIGAGMFLYGNGLAALERAGVLADVLAAGWSSPDGRNPYLDAAGGLIAEIFYPTRAPAPARLPLSRRDALIAAA
jgi:2-polyprenyl-6-methoxyphenol hydroxylase-like FAD-dependent oxidoreductase